MSETKEKIEVNNQKALLSSLRNDIIEASTALSQIYDELKQVLKKTEVAKQELATTLTEIVDARKELERDTENAKNLVRDADKYVERIQEQIKVLKAQKKESMTELKRLNEWVFTAEEQKKQLETEYTDLLQQNTEKRQFISDIAVFKKERDELKEENRIIRIDSKLAEDEAEAKMAQADKKVKKAEDMVKEAEKRAEEAKQAEYDANKRAVKVHADLEIYIQRVEKHYKKAFPNLRMKI